MNLDMFKAYDIRVKDSKLSKEDLLKLSNAIARYFKDDVKASSVVIGRDARLYGPRVMESLLDTLTRAGLDVYYNPLQISTCQFYYMCMKRPKSAGIMITASHNPKEYVGCKLLAPGVVAIAEASGPFGGLDRIKKHFIDEAEPTPSDKKGNCFPIYEMEEFVDYTLSLASLDANSLRGMKILADFLSGSSGAEFAHAFKKAGADITLLHSIPDGNFPSGVPNPLVESSLKKARETMRAGDYDLGFILDGDGDRIDFMHSDGSQVLPSLNFSAILPYMKELSPSSSKCYLDPKSLPLAALSLAKSDIEPHLIRNGHSFIKAKLRENRDSGYFAAVEESAHYYANFPCPNGGYASTENTLFIALLAAKLKRSDIDKLREIQDSFVRVREWSLFYNSDEYKTEVLEKVESKLLSINMVKIDTMDDGSDLDASLFRLNLPAAIAKDTEIPFSWAQVSQRISRSEDSLTRWEITASDPALANEIESLIKSVTDIYVERGLAIY